MRMARLLACVRPFLCAGGVLLAASVAASSASAQSRARNFDGVSAFDLSRSLLRDNYDVWAGEVMNILLVESVKKIAPLQEEIGRLSEDERQLSAGVRSRLEQLYASPVVDETSVRAAILLADMSDAKKRREYLRNAVRMAQMVAPGSLTTLRVGLVYLSGLLSQREVSDAARFSPRLNELAGQSALRGESDTCLAHILIGDVEFESGNYASAESHYLNSQSCWEAAAAVQSRAYVHLLQLRLAWSSFRLMKYSESVSRLEKLASWPEWNRDSISPALSADLGVMLGVAFSEIIPASFPTSWLNRLSRDVWVADGLVKTIKYLVQKEQYKQAVRWAEVLEPYLSNHRFAADYFAFAIDAFEKDGSIESMNDFRSRAVIALHPQGALARTLALDAAADARRKALLGDWARAVISFRAQQDVAGISPSTLGQLFRVAEGLYEDNVDVCSVVDPLLTAHRTLSAATHESFSERVFGWLRNCAMNPRQQRDLLLGRIEMYRALSKFSQRDLKLWKKYFELAMSATGSLTDDTEIRRMAIELLNDAIERRQFQDAEKIFLHQTLSVDIKSESSHWELDALVVAAERLFSLPAISQQLQEAGWVLQRSLARTSAPFNPRRQKVEATIAFAESRIALESRRSGNIQAAVTRLAESADRFAADSVYGRDLLFRAVQESCMSSLDRQCLELSEKFLGLPSSTAHENFLVSHWRAELFARSGRFLGAGLLWLSSHQSALDSQRTELIKLAKDNVVRAGDVFAELKFWNETLQARSALTKISAQTGEVSGTHESLLRWTLQAAFVDALDVALEMSRDLNLWLPAEKKNGSRAQKVAGAAEIVGRLTESSLASMAAGKSPAAYRSQLAGALKLLELNRGRLFISERKLEGLAHRFLALASRHWQNGVLEEGEFFSRVAEVGGLEAAVRRLSDTFTDLVGNCRVFQKHNLSPDCLPLISKAYTLYSERLERTSERIAGADPSRLRRLDARLAELRNQVAALGLSGSNSFADERVPLTGFVERQLDVLGAAGAVTSDQRSSR